jgi:ribosome-binding factor A
LEFQRSHRVGEAIHKSVSALLSRGLRDPRIGFVTVTSVDVTPDMHLARVYYTVVGDDKSRRDTAVGLEKAAPYIRRQLAGQLKLRYMPELIFAYDASVDYGVRIESLLKEIADGRESDSEDPEQD